MNRKQRRKEERLKEKNKVSEIPQTFQMSYTLHRPWSDILFETTLPPMILEKMILYGSMPLVVNRIRVREMDNGMRVNPLMILTEMDNGMILLSLWKLPVIFRHFMNCHGWW